MNVKRFTVLAALITLLSMPLTASGCSGGSVVTPEDFKDFTRLDIQNAFDVQVIQSGTYSVEITSSKALLDYLSVTKEGETLTVKLSPNHPFTDFVLMRKVLKAKITLPVLRGLGLSGASRAAVRGFESTNALDLNVSGVSTVALDGIETGDADLEVSGASDLNGKLTASNVKFDISGSSHVELDGTAKDVHLTASGASKLDLEGFVNRTATVTLSGASQVTIDTRDHLDFSQRGFPLLLFEQPQDGEDGSPGRFHGQTQVGFRWRENRDGVRRETASMVADLRKSQKVKVLPLVSERWKDLESVVGSKGDSGCWCMWWRLGDEEFEEQRGEANKMALREIVDSVECPGSSPTLATSQPAGARLDRGKISYDWRAHSCSAR